MKDLPVIARIYVAAIVLAGAVVLTVKATGLVYTWLGGPPPGASISVFDFSSASELQIAKPLVGAATAYFVCNTAFVATAISLSTRQQIFKVWNENFLWSAPSY